MNDREEKLSSAGCALALILGIYHQNDYSSDFFSLPIIPQHRSQKTCDIFVGFSPTRTIYRWIFVQHSMNWTITLGACSGLRCICMPTRALGWRRLVVLF